MSKLISEIFFNLTHKHFSYSPTLNEIFNKNVKVSYSYAKNIDQYISQHNCSILNKDLNNLQNSNIPATNECNCQKNKPYPLNGRCMTKSLVYKAEIKYDDEVKFYVCSRENRWNSYFYHHQITLGKIKYRNSTALSKFFWKVKARIKIQLSPGNP